MKDRDYAKSYHDKFVCTLDSNFTCEAFLVEIGKETQAH